MLQAYPLYLLLQNDDSADPQVTAVDCILPHELASFIFDQGPQEFVLSSLGPCGEAGLK